MRYRTAEQPRCGKGAHRFVTARMSLLSQERRGSRRSVSVEGSQVGGT
jgi:hypothetical protein